MSFLATGVGATVPGVDRTEWPTWREAWQAALYGPSGFYRRESPRDHFRTSVHASPLLAEAVCRLARRRGLASVLDLGAGGGELLTQLSGICGAELSLGGVDLAPRPSGIAASIAWSRVLPERIDGLVVANEWLDNVPCDVVELDRTGVPRVVHVETVTGAEGLGARCTDPWLPRWWPLAHPGDRAEVGSARDEAWNDLVRRLDGGLAVAIDYGHTRGTRPRFGSLASYRRGRLVDTVPDGSRDVTAHVAVDSLQGHRVRQRDALHVFGIDGSRPAVELARTDPTAYLAALGRASQAAELIAGGGLGDFWWVSSAPIVTA